jgi:hypothetical protein
MDEEYIKYEIDGGHLDFYIESGEIAGYSGNAKTLKLPNEINGMKVNGLSAFAFAFKKNLTRLDLPKNFKYFGEYAIEGCCSLAEINVDSKNPFLSAQNGILFNKDKTELLACGGAVTEVIIPDTVKAFEFAAFIDCCNFQKVTIPEGVEYLNDELFFGCSELVTVKLPKSLKRMGRRVFERCGFLENIELPDGLEEIGSTAFVECFDLRKLYIPKSVRYIGKEAFERITKGLVISVEKGSYAEAYLKHYGYPHKVL